MNPKIIATNDAKIPLIGSIKKYADRNDRTIAAKANPIIVHANLDSHHLIQFAIFLVFRFFLFFKF